MFHFLKNIERGGKHAQKPSIVIVLLAFAIFFFLCNILPFYIVTGHYIVSDLELHSLISKHAEQKKKTMKKNMHIEKVLDFNMLTASC